MQKYAFSFQEGANGVPNSQLTTIFLAISQLNTNFGLLFLHNPNFPSFSKSITFGGRLSENQGINLHELCL